MRFSIPDAAERLGGVFVEKRSMYLNHPLVPDSPITLRYGEERDGNFLAKIFTEVWEEIPQLDRSAILARGYGDIQVDVSESRTSHPAAASRKDIRLPRAAIDTYPRNVIAHLVAHELARKVDDYVHANPAALQRESRRNVSRRVETILERWGYPLKATPEFTPADNVRIRANLAAVENDQLQETSQEQEA
jgi:hypothetical protein